MIYQEDEYLMLSGIQHFAFCRRQWAIIHIEKQWEENVHTVLGDIMHERAHDIRLTEQANGNLIVRALPVKSQSLGISGECDIVEFKKVKNGITIFGHNGLYSVCPVEYKKGKPKVDDVDILQLVAQVICLEEMFYTEIKYGYLYYGETRRRIKIEITKELRDKVNDMFYEMHVLYNKEYTPKVKWSKSCNACSLKEICLPKIGKKKSVKAYMNKYLGED